MASTFLASLLSLGGCSNTGSPPVEPPSVAVRVAAASRQDLFSQVSYVGTVHSRREVRVIAQIPGTVISLAAEGETVRVGQGLARIAAGETEARATRVDAEVQRAVTERDFLCKTFATDQQLGTAGAISKTQVDLSRRACESADAALSAARATSLEVGAGTRKTVETAPFAGRVLQWLAEPGQNVMPGTPLLLLGGHELELRVPVAERDIPKGVAPGRPALVQLEGSRVRLSVTEVAPMATGPGRSVEVRIHLPSELVISVGHGFSARVDLVLAEAPNTLAVPEQALWQVGEHSSVFVIENDRARQVSVEPGIRDRGWIAIAGEIPEGALLAVSTLDVLQNGTRVFPVSSGNDGAVQP